MRVEARLLLLASFRDSIYDIVCVLFPSLTCPVQCSICDFLHDHLIIAEMNSLTASYLRLKQRMWDSAPNILPMWRSTGSRRRHCSPAPKVEDYQEGYPQFSALIATHEDFFICRNFRRTRARILLAKQDRLSSLEKQLDCIDEHESLPLFLGKMRGDRNSARTSLLAEIESSMDDYGTFPGSHCIQMYNLPMYVTSNLSHCSPCLCLCHGVWTGTYISVHLVRCYAC